MLLPPFHADELAAQERAGVASSGAGIRASMPDQHRSFFAMLPFAFLGVSEPGGWPIATMLTGAPGFIAAPDPHALHVTATPSPHDPAAAAIRDGAGIGLLGIELATRRRNRANGVIKDANANGFTIAVRQSFGNCPQYIQRREIASLSATTETGESLPGLDAEARALIAASDTFFVASRSRAGIDGGGSDISHRGGRPGFVRVVGDRLTIPDFRGNRYFNTLGNLLGEPRAGLLFVDFARGDLLQLQGTVTIDWQPGPIAGAERLWHFETARAWRRRGGSPLRWAFRDFAPQLGRTGVWSG